LSEDPILVRQARRVISRRARLVIIGSLGLCLLMVPFAFQAKGSVSDTTVLSNEQRLSLGLTNGPDSIPEVIAMGGATYTLFSGLNAAGQRGTFRFSGTLLDRLTPSPAAKDPSSGAVIPRPVLRPGKEQPLPPELGGIRSPDGSYNGFDRDYAGGGTALNIDGEIFYFYHGENIDRSRPSGEVGPPPGWSGIGLAIWDPWSQNFEKLGQIVGMTASNGLSATGEFQSDACKQAAPMSDEANAVLNPDDGYVYLFYSDSTPKAEKRSHVTVARASAKSLREAAKSRQCPSFLKFYQGEFSQPGLTQLGLGGPSSPILDRLGYRSAHVVWLASRRQFVMAVGRGQEQIFLLTSSNATSWSEPRPVGRALEGHRILYPYLWPTEPGEFPLRLVYLQIAEAFDPAVGRKRAAFKFGATMECVGLPVDVLDGGSAPASPPRKRSP
jgi:hypothetical protein